MAGSAKRRRALGTSRSTWGWTTRKLRSTRSSDWAVRRSSRPRRSRAESPSHSSRTRKATWWDWSLGDGGVGGTQVPPTRPTWTRRTRQPNQWTTAPKASSGDGGGQLVLVLLIVANDTGGAMTQLLMVHDPERVGRVC